MEKCCRAGQATDDHMARAQFMFFKARDTRLECVTITAFPLQRSLHELASMLGYT